MKLNLTQNKQLPKNCDDLETEAEKIACRMMKEYNGDEKKIMNEVSGIKDEKLQYAVRWNMGFFLSVT